MSLFVTTPPRLGSGRKSTERSGVATLDSESCRGQFSRGDGDAF